MYANDDFIYAGAPEDLILTCSAEQPVCAENISIPCTLHGWDRMIVVNAMDYTAFSLSENTDFTCTVSVFSGKTLKTALPSRKRSFSGYKPKFRRISSLQYGKVAFLRL